MTGALDDLLRAERAREATRFRRATACAVLLGVAAVALLGVSGWFIAASAAAGLAGIAAAASFNYLLPSAAIRLLAIARTGARYGERLLGHEAALRTLARIRPAIFAAVTRTAPARALGLSSGEAATALVQDVQAIELRLAQRTAFAGAAAAATCGIGLSGLASVAAALSTLACLSALLLVADVLAKRAARTAVAVRRAVGGLKEDLSLLAASQVELRCYALEDWAADAAARASDALEAAQRRHARVLGALDAAQAVATGLAATAGLWFARSAGAPLAALAGLAAAMTIDGAGPLLRAWAHRGVAKEAALRLDGLLAAPQADDEALSTTIARVPTIELPPPFAARLAPGDRVAIVGPSGCGKSTLVETLVGLRAALPGAARIDGRDLAELPATRSRACFAWLPQEAPLIAGSVRDNLRLAGDDVDEAAMWRALRDVLLADRVRAWPDGLDTWLGEDGARLSGGERRRLALARAYLRDAPWLLLDEPTVGLDDATEAGVLRALRARLDDTGQGLVVVTHRASVALLCERRLEFGASTQPLASLAA